MTSDKIDSRRKKAIALLNSRSLGLPDVLPLRPMTERQITMTLNLITLGVSLLTLGVVFLT